MVKCVCICLCVYNTRPLSRKLCTGAILDQSKHTQTHADTHTHCPPSEPCFQRRGALNALQTPNKHNFLCRPSSICSIWPCCNLQHTYLIETLLRSQRGLFCICLMPNSHDISVTYTAQHNCPNIAEKKVNHIVRVIYGQCSVLKRNINND